MKVREININKQVLLEAYFMGDQTGHDIHTSGRLPKGTGDLDARDFVKENNLKINFNKDYSSLSENNIALLLWKVESVDKNNKSTVTHTPLFKDMKKLKIKEVLDTIYKDVMSMSSYYKGNHIFKFPKNCISQNDVNHLRNTKVNITPKYLEIDIKN